MSDFLGINTNDTPPIADPLAQLYSPIADPLAQLYSSPAGNVKLTWRQTPIGQFFVKLGWGCLCSVLIGCVKGMPFIIKGIRWACHITLLVLGMPDGAEKLADKIKPLADQGRVFVREQSAKPEGGFLHRTLDSAKRKVASEAVKHTVTTVTDTAAEKLAPVREKAEAVVDTGKAAAQKLGDAVERLGLPPKHSPPPVLSKQALDGLRKPSGMGGTFGRFSAGISEYALAQARDRLMARAAAVQVEIKPEWSPERLDYEVNKAEDAKWPTLYNAQCPNCRNPMFVKPSQKKKQAHCLRCRKPVSLGRALACGTPPRPRTGLPLR